MLVARGHTVERQVPVPVVFEGVTVRSAFRMDLLVDERVLVEIKSVQSLLKVHFAQVLTYLKLSGAPLALLINFNSVPLHTGIHRIIRRTLEHEE